MASYALNLGRSWWTVAMQISTLANFYLTTWEEFHTGKPLFFLDLYFGDKRAFATNVCTA